MFNYTSVYVLYTRRLPQVHTVFSDLFGLLYTHYTLCFPERCVFIFFYKYNRRIKYNIYCSIYGIRISLQRIHQYIRFKQRVHDYNKMMYSHGLHGGVCNSISHTVVNFMYVYNFTANNT